MNKQARQNQLKALYWITMTWSYQWIESLINKEIENRQNIRIAKAKENINILNRTSYLLNMK